MPVNMAGGVKLEQWPVYCSTPGVGTRHLFTSQSLAVRARLLSIKAERAQWPHSHNMLKALWCLFMASLKVSWEVWFVKDPDERR